MPNAIESEVQSALHLTGGPWQIAGMLLAAALFWLQYIDLKDRLRPEPRRRLVGAFVLGIIACALALGAFWLTDVLGFPEFDEGDSGWLATYCFLVIGPVEEGAKLLVALLIAFRWKEFDEPIDGLVYAAAIALGFATLENFIHLPGLPLGQQLGRAFALPFTHTLFAGVWGLAIAHARFRIRGRWQRTWLQIGAVMAAMGLHGLYDWLIFAHRATGKVSALVFVLWAMMIWQARKAVTLPVENLSIGED
ncbi:PrsW family intramembrane metalloprotease [bacterium]|nr:PrsW family intramembrane metalloprotease [bacterium]